MTTASTTENRGLKTYSDEVEIFLRVLTVNVVGGVFWALIQPLKDYDPSNLLLIIASGAIVGCIFSISSLLIPRFELEKRGEVYRVICYLIYSLASVYLTASIIFLLTASVIILSGGNLGIRSDGGFITYISMDDLLSSYSLDYILELSLIPITGSPVVVMLKFVKNKLLKYLHDGKNSNKR